MMPTSATDCANSCLDTALALAARGLPIVLARGKRPLATDWGSRRYMPAEIEAEFRREPGLSLGVILGPASGLIDLETDSADEEADLSRLFDGTEPEATPTYRSARGKHRLYCWDARLAATGAGIVYFGKLGCRIGAGGRAAQSIIPPSVVDGVARAWVEGLSLEDRPPAPLPEVVVERLLAAARPAASGGAAAAGTGNTDTAERLRRAVAAMLRQRVTDKADGSNRLYTWARRAVEHDLADSVAVAAIRAAEAAAPFPRAWSDEEIVSRLRAAEKKSTRGAALHAKPKEVARSAAEAPQGQLPRIVLSEAEHEGVAAAIEALRREPRIFKRSGQLVQVVEPDPAERGRELVSGGPRIVAVEVAKVRTLLTGCAQFVKRVKLPDGGEVEVEAHPPQWLVQGVAADAEWRGIRSLVAVSESPVLRADGSIAQTPGYDAQTGVVYLPSAAYPPVPDHPVRAEVEAARDLLLEVVAEFPFQAAEHRAAWLAGLLTPLARFAFQGPAPLFLIDANTRGSGKGLLADTIAQIATGHDFARQPYTRDDDETRKAITAIALSGERLVLLDNIAGTLGSAALDAALTSTTWQARLLGTNDQPRLPLLCSWFATGNNVALGADTARRVCHIRLQSPLERPEERQGFAHPDLLAYVRQNRPGLLVAALTLLRGYYAADRPTAGLKPWGSFEGWSAVVREVVVWAGLPDPAGTRDELMRASDTEADLLRLLLTGWAELDPAGRGLTTAEACRQIDLAPVGALPAMRQAMAEIRPGRGGRPGPRELGYMLRKFAGRVVGGRALEGRAGHGGVKVWRVVISRGGGGDSCDGCDVSANLNFAYACAGAQQKREWGETSPPSPSSPPPGEVLLDPTTLDVAASRAACADWN